MNNKINSLTIAQDRLTGTKKEQEKFNSLLDKLGIKYQYVDHYLQVGEINMVQGWILHLSVVISQLSPMLEVVVPFLISEKVPFKIVIDKKRAVDLLNGLLGITQIGKLVCIYPQNDERALCLAKKLVELTQSFKGPAIYTDQRLGNVLFTRYGSFNPIRLNDGKGKEEKYIYNIQGQLVKDHYTIPFLVPESVHWPFAELVIPATPASKKVLKNKYRYVSILKTDPRGNVYLCVYLKGIFQTGKCVVKQGIQHMCSEDTGRDVRDRLLWQQELHDKLGSLIPLPKIFDVFEEDGNTYIAMEYIKGESLSEVMKTLNPNHKSWFELGSGQRIALLDYLITISEIIETLHQKGYVHRDIAPGNFLITKNNQIFLIDLELAYSVRQHKPSPPFQFGTEGFMSPEQQEVFEPTTKEDIYGLGALILHLLTGISPVKLDVENPSSLFEKIMFFIQDGTVAKMIAACLQTNVAERPTIKHIIKTLDNYKSELLNNQHHSNHEIQLHNLNNIVIASIKGLNTAPIISYEGIWCSKLKYDYTHASVPQKEFTRYIGLSEGVSGVLYLLARAVKAGYDINSTIFYNAWKYVEEELRKEPDIEGGLYGGKAGIAIALKEALEAGLIETNESIVGKLNSLLYTPNKSLDVTSGIAGQGIAILQCKKYINAEKMLDPIVDMLLKEQLRDGTWVSVGQINMPEKLKKLSFEYGTVGITWFLLQYSSIYRRTAVLLAAENALEWILKQTNSFMKRKHYWSLNKRENNSIANKYNGILVTLIKAFEVLREERYRQIVEEALSRVPTYMISNNLTQLNGLAFIGELYLEAARLFENNKWQLRANWIADVLFHLFKKSTSDAGYWKTEEYNHPTADFLTGNGGIIHYILRYQSPNTLGIRLLE